MIDVEGRLGASVDSDTRPSNWSCTHAGIHHSEQREGLLTKSWRPPLAGMGFGLALFTKLSGALSMWGRRRAPSREGLRNPGRKVNSESLCASGDQPEKKRERETQGPEL